MSTAKFMVFLAAMVLLSSESSWAACIEGQEQSCTTNGKRGTRTCIVNHAGKLVWGPCKELTPPPPPSSGSGIEFEMPIDTQPPPRPSTSRLKINPDGSVIAVNEDPLAGLPDKMWNPGQILRVKMTGGSDIVRSKVRSYAEEWMRYANIVFQFVDDSSSADIRVGFEAGKGSSSAVGRDALGVSSKLSTMNFGWITDSNAGDIKQRGTVLHEFGHALGLIHEHQSPVAGIPWDKEKVYRWFKENQTPPWDKAKVDLNVFDKFNNSSTNYSRFDPTSIMLYAVPAELTLDGVGTSRNNLLSAVDKEYIGKWYPFPGADSGQLRTNDDCDEIDFEIQYGVEAPGEIAFYLQPGVNVSWWKLIEIPIAANAYSGVAVDDAGVPCCRAIFSKDIDRSRPIRFNKAKGIGVHSLLDYRWDVLNAIPDRSRVNFIWKRDKC